MNKRKNLSKAYLTFAIIGILVTIVGFIPTYFRPLLEAKKFGLVFHFHGLFAASWLILFLVQTTLINKQNVGLHKKLGYFGLFIMIGLVISLQLVGFTQSGILAQEGSHNVITFLGTILDSLTFGILVLLGIINRKRIEIHKRLMLLATILLLWVAWVRLRYYFPPFEGNFDVFGFGLAMLPIPIFWLIEYSYFRKIHPVMLYVGIAVIFEQGFQVLFSESKFYMDFAADVFRLAGGSF